jgi:methionyl-tRNA formyltransferase
MKIVFFGNSEKSLIGAKIIHQAIGISFIVTISDRLGKRKEVTVSPLKTFAQEQKITYLTTAKIDEKTIDTITQQSPDFLVVEDYGLILPKKLLAVPRFAPLNVHHSLLPKYRGPAPAPYTILAGEKISGVSIIHMNDTVDAGDIYAQEEYKLTPEETTDSLLTKLNELGGHLVVKVINTIVEKQIVPTKQEEVKVIMTHYMDKSDGHIKLDHPPTKDILDRMIRAYYPWPSVWTKIRIRNKELRIKFLPEKRVQLEGKKPILIKDFLNGYPEIKLQLEKLL